MKRVLPMGAALLLAAGCGEGERNVAAVEPEPPLEMSPDIAEDPDLANAAAAAEAEDAEHGGSADTPDVNSG